MSTARANHGTAVSAEGGVVIPYAGGQKRQIDGEPSDDEEEKPKVPWSANGFIARANHGTAVSAEGGVVVPYAGGQKRDIDGECPH